MTEVEGLMIRFWHINGTSATVDGKTFYGQEYDAQDGFLYFDNFNESLDGGTVYLPPQDKIEFEPFDIVEITSGINDSIRKTMLIDTYIETQVANLIQSQIQISNHTDVTHKGIRTSDPPKHRMDKDDTSHLVCNSHSKLNRRLLAKSIHQ